MNFGDMSSPQRLAGASILVTAIAAFLPWASIFAISIRGIDGDGKITLVCAIVGAILLALHTGLIGSNRLNGKRYYIPAYIAAGIVALVGIFDMNGVSAIGLYLTLFAGIAWVVALFWEYSLNKQPTPEEGSSIT